jgi:hypothetical protein
MGYASKCASEKSTIENTDYFREFISRLTKSRQQTLEILGDAKGDEVLKLQGKNIAIKEVLALWDTVLDEIKHRESKKEE